MPVRTGLSFGVVRKPGSGDPQHQQASVEVELLGVDGAPAPSVFTAVAEGHVPGAGPARVEDQTEAEIEAETRETAKTRETAGSAETAGTVTGQATIGGRRGLVTALGGVTVVLILVVGLLFGIDRAAPDPPPAAPEFRQPSGLVTTTTVPPVEPRVITVPTTIPSTTLPPGQFLLGEQTGQWLFFGGDDTLHRLDLDSGELVDYGLRAVPIAATGEDLVLHLPDAGLVGWIPAAEPGTQPATWKVGQVALGDEPGQIWVLDPDEDVPHPAGEPVGYGSWELFDTGSATSESLGQRPGDLYQEIEDNRPDGDELPASVAPLRPGPTLSARPDSVVIYGDDRYRTVDGPAEILAFNKELILIRRCDPQPCTVLWTSTELGDDGGQPPIQRPTQDVLLARFVADGQWLLAYYPGGESELIEVAGTGRFRFGAGASPAMSNDGRWLASQSDGQYVIVSADTGQEMYRFGTPAPDGPPGDLADQPANGFVFTTRSLD